jgi:hypothetical protein
MMLEHFEKAAARHDEITKEAWAPIIRGAAALAKRVGGWTTKNKGKALGGALTVGFLPMDVAAGKATMRQGTLAGRAAASAARSPAGTFDASPVF